jgi:hypothetical protein
VRLVYKIMNFLFLLLQNFALHFFICGMTHELSQSLLIWLFLYQTLYSSSLTVTKIYNIFLI